MICITGLSGSGKSSLAFDTIYAEGQRRYVESLSAYARQFLQMMEKPDVDSIDGLSPAISIDQKTTSRNPRSTVGTVTEIYDYLRLLYARVGGRTARSAAGRSPGQSIDSIVEQILALPEGHALHRQRAGRARPQGRVPRRCSRASATRASRASRSTASSTSLDEPPALDKKFKHTIEVVVDRLVMKEDLRLRLTPVGRDRGRARRRPRRDRPARERREPHLLRAVRLPRARRVAAGAPAADLLLQLAARRLPALHRARRAAGDRPRPARSRPEPLDRRGRARALGGRQLELLRVGDPGDRRPLRDRPPTCRGASSTEQQQGYFLYGTGGDKVYVSYRNRMGRRRAYTIAFEGIVASLQRRYRETDSSSQRERIEEYMSFRPCPVCKGARLKPEVLAVTVGGRNIHEFTQLSVTAALALPRRARAERDRGADRRPDREGDPRAADLPRQRRRRLSRARPRLGDALGRRGAAAAARDPDRLAARRRALHPRRAVDRAPPARQRPADRHARARCAISATPWSSSSTTSR